jgi:hypothetical protein
MKNEDAKLEADDQSVEQPTKDDTPVVHRVKNGEYTGSLLG